MRFFLYSVIPEIKMKGEERKEVIRPSLGSNPITSICFHPESPVSLRHLSSLIQESEQLLSVRISVHIVIGFLRPMGQSISPDHRSTTPQSVTEHRNLTQQAGAPNRERSEKEKKNRPRCAF